MTRRSWAVKVVDDCSAMSQEAQNRYAEIEVMTQGVDSAKENLGKHVKALDQKTADIQAWARDVRKEEELAAADWESSVNRLRALPATNNMVRFITGREPRKAQQKLTLEDLIDVAEVTKASKLVRDTSANLSRNSADLGTRVDEIMRKTDDLYDKVRGITESTAARRAAEPAQLMQDIEAIAKKVSNDYESVLGYSNTSKNISQASKSALNHTKALLPNLSRRSLEMDDLLRTATELRNIIAATSLETMRDIAALTSMIADANDRFGALELNDSAMDAFQLLSRVTTLPVTYASFLAEAIRRREWNEKVRSDSSTLANEMASFQEEEAKRRRKWQKSTGLALWGEKAERTVVGLEVNLLGEDEDWPQVSRQDLDQLLEILRSQGANAEIISDVVKIISDLSNPTKQQSKRAKAFKAGSIHEAALGRSALLMRGDDELIRNLQEEKQKIESKLKTAESRVRRLEDLLHRQSQVVSRTSTGNGFQFPSNPSPDYQNGHPLGSPRVNDDISRRSSVSSRRFSANQGAEEKVFQQKLLTMEAELIAERERSSGLEKEVDARKNIAKDLQAQVDDANSTKTDLMGNFNAQQQEFLEERKSLESEIERFKARIEELEDEMDRYLGSRENEKATVDERVRMLQDELENLRKETAAEAQKAHGQVDFLRNDAKLQRETNEALEKQLQAAKLQNKELLARAEKAELLAGEQKRVLEDVHTILTHSAALPDDLASLTEVLVGISGDLVAELKSVKSAAVVAKSDRDAAQAAVLESKSAIEELKEILASEQAQSSELRDALGAEQAKFSALEAELSDERNQLSILRSKIGDGETGSEALRTRLEEEERKVTRISEDLAARQSRIGSLEEELRTLQEKFQSTYTKQQNLSSRFEARTLRAKDLTQRIYAQNDRLCRLLERLSYSVTREGSSMIIQRIPRPERTNANDSSDPGSSIRRSISGAITRKSMVDSGDLDLLYWMQNEDEDTESEKYEAYLNAIGNFDVEAFCEIITKRIKDMEYTAKKYSKDARAYREKSHMAQKEAHEKIAFKNFKEGDLALFLPTRNQAGGAWAAFNLGAPHFFLKEEESHRLRARDWLVARIHKIEDRVVDLSKSMTNSHLNVADRKSLGDTSNGGESFEDDNPFDLSDGLRWYLIHASEEKPGAPSTPGLGKTTVGVANVDAQGSIRRSKKSSSSGVDGINKTLSKSLDSRRSSNNSKKSVPAPSNLIRTGSTATDLASLKGAPTTQTTGEGSEAHIIRSGSRQDIAVLATAERAPSSEVRNPLDDLMGP
jgi:autophagy-related protein 11